MCFDILLIYVGPSLPKRIWGHSIVTLHMDLVVIGGIDSSVLYRFTCDQGQCQWHQMNSELKIPRSQFVAMAIPDELVNCD